jgi:hypothetical protein
MKFLLPEEEIRAQLSELTSQSRRLRADIQGMITRRGPSDKAFSHDQRYRLKPERSRVASAEEPEAEANEPAAPPRKSPRRSSPRKRR